MFAALAIAASAWGCARSLGPTAIGALGPGSEDLAVMRLRPDVEATSCRRWVLGIPVDDAGPVDPVAALAGGLLAREPEATVLSEADVRWEHVSFGVYERQCVTLRGALGRTMRTITIPVDPTSHHHAH